MTMRMKYTTKEFFGCPKATNLWNTAQWMFKFGVAGAAFEIYVLYCAFGEDYIHIWPTEITIGCFGVPALIAVLLIPLSYKLRHKADAIGEAYIEDHLKNDLQYAIAFVAKYPDQKTAVL